MPVKHVVDVVVDVVVVVTGIQREVCGCCVKNNSPVLGWTDRQKILKDVASGLQYLHTVDRRNALIHGDVKR